MKLVRKIFLLTVFSALTGAAWVAHRAPRVEELRAAIAGNANGNGRDLLDLLRQTAMKRSGTGRGGAAIEISEADINRYLQRRLKGTLPAALAGWVTFDGVLIDLHNDVATLHLLWALGGSHASGASVDFGVRREGDAFRVELRGGAYGHLRVPRGMMRPLAPALDRVVAALQPEIEALFQMNQITLMEDKVVLDPRFPAT